MELERRNSLPFTIELMADHLDLVPTIAQWHHEEWRHFAPDYSLEACTSDMAARTNRDRIPMVFLAFDKGAAVGSVMLVKDDLATRRDLSPWLAGLYVVPPLRGRGIGTALVHKIVCTAAKLRIPALYLYTQHAERFYKRLGWTEIGRDRLQGYEVAVMSIEPASAVHSSKP